MTKKLFIALYFGLFASMVVMFFINSPGAFVFISFLFLAVFGGLLFADRPAIIVLGFLIASLIVLGIGLFISQNWITMTVGAGMSALSGFTLFGWQYAA